MKIIRVWLLFILLTFMANCSSKVPNAPEQNQNKSNQKPPIVSLQGFREGHNIVVDGPLWYDGTAKLEKLNPQIMRLSVSMVFPDIPNSFAVKDDKVSLIVELSKNKNNKYKLLIHDRNNDNVFTLNNVTITKGKTEGGLFSEPQRFIKLTYKEDNEITFVVEAAGKVSVKTNKAPISIMLVRKDLA